MPAQDIEACLRAEAGPLLAGLCRRFGSQHLERAEDAVQAALLRALESWPTRGWPDAPRAWLRTVATNALLEDLRRHGGTALEAQLGPGGLEALPIDGLSCQPAAAEPPDPEDVLALLFAVSRAKVSQPGRIAFALRALLGFEVEQIAERMFATPASTYKRLERARAWWQVHRPDFAAPLGPARPGELADVHALLYTLFTEGYLPSVAAMDPDRGTCESALRLAELLHERPLGRCPEGAALCALMQLHLARMAGRQDPGGDLLLLAEQDRGTWDRALIAAGLGWLERSASGEAVTRYHAEAGIAAEHALAPTYTATRWERIDELYGLLDSPIHRLNRAVARAEWRGPLAGLSLLTEWAPPAWLLRSPWWPAVQADLHRRAGHRVEADRWTQEALRSAQTPAIRALLARRLQAPAP